MGDAIRIDKRINLIKSFESKDVIPKTDAPSTLRMPISLVRCSAVNVASPKRPRHAIKIAMMAEYFMSCDVRSSFS